MHAVPSPHWQLNDPEWLRTEYLERGRTGADLAAEVGVHPNTLARALERHGIRKTERRTMASVPKRWLREQHVKRGRSTRDIARELDVAPTSVQRALVEAGIPVNDRRLPAELYDVDWLTTNASRSAREIGRELGCSADAVARARRRHGLAAGQPSQFPQLDDRAWLQDCYHRQGKTQQAIADELGCSRSAVALAMDRLGVDARRRQVRYPRLDDRDWLERRVAAGRSAVQIAGELGCHRTSVAAALRRHGLR